MTDKLNRLEKIFEFEKINNDKVSQSEFSVAIKSLLDSVREVRKEIENKLEQSLLQSSEDSLKDKNYLVEYIDSSVQLSRDSIKEFDSIVNRKLLSLESKTRVDLIDLQDKLEGLLEEKLSFDSKKYIDENLSKFKESVKLNASKIRDELESLEGSDRLDISAIKGLSERDVRLGNDIVNRALGILDSRTAYLLNKLSKVSHDSTLTGDGTPGNPLSVVGGSSSGLKVIGLSGSINDSNLSFTTPAYVQTITAVYINGTPYQSTGGAYTWTFDGTTITLSSPVGLGGSIFAVGFVLSSETVTGTINDTNLIFTTTTEPQILVINGDYYLPTGGSYTWTYSNGIITLSNPVGFGGSISAIYDLGVVESDGSVAFSSGFSSGFY